MNQYKPGQLILSNQLFQINNRLEETAIRMKKIEDLENELQQIAAERVKLLKEKQHLIKAIYE